MKLTVVTPPVEEPITLSEAREHLRVDGSEENATITALIAAARQRAELECWRALVTQTLRLTLDCWPENGRIQLPRPPLQSVTSVQYTDDDGNTSTFAASNYIVSTAAEPGQVALKWDSYWPTETLQTIDGVTVAYVAGYGDSEDVPELLKQAMLLVIGHWFENREEVIVGAGLASSAIPQGATSIFQMFRVY